MNITISKTVYTLRDPNQRFVRDRGSEGTYTEYIHLAFNTCARCKHSQCGIREFEENDLIECQVNHKWISPMQRGMVCFHK